MPERSDAAKYRVMESEQHENGFHLNNGANLKD
jgi:hypothetical protein